MGLGVFEYQALLDIRNATRKAAQAGQNTVPVELYREQQQELAVAKAHIVTLREQLRAAEDRARLHKLREDVQTENLANSKKHLAELDAWHERKAARLSAEIADLKKQLASRG